MIDIFMCAADEAAKPSSNIGEVIHFRTARTPEFFRFIARNPDKDEVEARVQLLHAADRIEQLEALLGIAPEPCPRNAHKG